MMPYTCDLQRTFFHFILLAMRENELPWCPSYKMGFTDTQKGRGLGEVTGGLEVLGPRL